METAVSVIIPVYNCEKTVGRCINSVLNQTLANIEVIAVNDGSDDSTLKVLKGINDDRLKIISHLNYGQGYARNNGMSVANGKYIAFVDADDTIEECMLEKMYEKAETENADMVQELAAMQRRMDSNQTLEEAMRDFAERSGIPEAETFAEIFTVGKRSGGDLIEIMEDTARTIAQTVETERAIAATLASRRYEQKIMNGIPFVIVLYLRIGCPGFMDPVYGNIVGVCVMTGCLLLYLGAWYLGRRMLEIEV